MSWLDSMLLAYRTVFGDGIAAPRRPATNYVGLTVTDDPVNQRTIVTAAEAAAGAQRGVYASRPAVGTQGQLYYATDAPYGYFDTGSIWAPFGPLYQMTEPPSTGWTSVATSGKTTTRDTLGHARRIQGSDFAGGEDWRLEYRTAPATPYTVKAHFLPLLNPTNFSAAGLLFRASGSGNLSLFVCYWNSAGTAPLMLQVRHVNASGSGAAATFSGAVAAYDIGQQGSPGLGNGLWLAVTDNGTSRLHGFSVDGITFNTVFSETRTTHITADQVGWGCGLGAAVAGIGYVGNVLDSWSGA